MLWTENTLADFSFFWEKVKSLPLTLRAVWKTKTFCYSAVFELKAWPVASLWVLGEAKAAPALPVASADPFRKKQEPRGREGKALTNPCLSAVLFCFADFSHLKTSANLMSTFHLSVWQLPMSGTSTPPSTHICSSYSAALEETQTEIVLWEMLSGFWVLVFFFKQNFSIKYVFVYVSSNTCLCHFYGNSSALHSTTVFLFWRKQHCLSAVELCVS